MKIAIGLGENKNVVEAIERFPFDRWKSVV